MRNIYKTSHKIYSMEDKTIITDYHAITLFNNFKKFYNAFRKINNIKIDKTIIIAFLKQLLELEYYEYSPNQFQMFSHDFKIQFMEKCQGNEMEIIKIYETYFKEHVGHKFICFLKTHKALDFYKDNLNKQMHDTLLSRILFCYPANYIDSFLWTCTNQGFGYWNYLHDEWMDIINDEGRHTQFTLEYFKQIRKIINEYNV